MEIRDLLSWISGKVNLHRLYFFVTSVLVTSTAFLLGALLEIGMSYLPLIDKSVVLSQILFWISVLSLVLVQLRNNFVSLWMGLPLSRIPAIAYVKRIREERFDDLVFTVCLGVVVITLIILGCLKFGKQSTYDDHGLLIASVAGVIYTGFASFRKPLRNMAIPLFYFAVIAFLFFLSASYIKVMRNSEYDIAIYFTDRDAVRAKILMSNERGLFFFAERVKRPFFYSWDNIRCMQPLLKGQQTLDKDCMERSQQHPASFPQPKQVSI